MRKVALNHTKGTVGKLKRAIESVNKIIDQVESRCLAADGPVTPTLTEMRESELRRLWKSLQKIKQLTASQP